MTDQKKGWWQISFLILAIPLKTMTWILDDEQMRGQEFTMNSVPMQIKRVEAPAEEYAAAPEKESASPKKKQDKQDGGNVISMFDED